MLREHGLSWTGFVVLWVVWIWDGLETRRAADNAAISKATLTGVVKTLEARGLIDPPGQRYRPAAGEPRADAVRRRLDEGAVSGLQRRRGRDRGGIVAEKPGPADQTVCDRSSPSSRQSPARSERAKRERTR